MKSFQRICIFIALLTLSIGSNAQMRKCITSGGKSIYTDQPCASKAGENAAEVKDSELLKKISSINGQKNLEKSCWILGHRDSQCYPRVISELGTVFRENCSIPSKQYEKDQLNGKRRPHRNNDPENEGDDLLFEHRYTEKSRSTLQCDALEKEMWDFLKSNFPKRISEQDAKIINYKLKISPTKNSESYY
ncbi:hypothetical protein [Undibacterium fentianense]|uniref:DUF4124 domain-containing protein n=1 Tax=Undibacterium fentianense TaxID=2828728 RepID=A0A941IEC6_9BURK|nr:hypothetical protein [Undibacterium fentianense]MBR7799262.1 hypothetical protein [Undibacterium fentianense]